MKNVLWALRDSGLLEDLVLVVFSFLRADPEPYVQPEIGYHPSPIDDRADDFGSYETDLVSLPTVTSFG